MVIGAGPISRHKGVGRAAPLLLDASLSPFDRAPPHARLKIYFPKKKSGVFRRDLTALSPRDLIGCSVTPISSKVGATATSTLDLHQMAPSKRRARERHRSVRSATPGETRAAAAPRQALRTSMMPDLILMREVGGA